jgi:hypothetical protein
VQQEQAANRQSTPVVQGRGFQLIGTDFRAIPQADLRLNGSLEIPSQLETGGQQLLDRRPSSRRRSGRLRLVKLTITLVSSTSMPEQLSIAVLRAATGSNMRKPTGDGSTSELKRPEQIQGSAD